MRLADRLRRSMLRYRDGAKVLAGTYINDEAMWRTVELTLHTLEDAGFSTVDRDRRRNPRHPNRSPHLTMSRACAVRGPVG
ncbi:hypothetical protein NBRGN_013_00090 [Nocardia brasiliensis NBRC 14402]|uniref:TetR/AcrR family transcriptional regulator C-terminal domain-containing protein n=1 Tax=Nocardia brasiliensis TaxID=37326 RepID=UPI0002D8CEA2|nr:TetR/AcrR family transcriptional regulator C-terminal domain-containing protein [Nocardia brasiliensis]GAJ79467.1 hypothetical protein NBRGN_013_00090 [Nocardia brasiliensis NBRC 14402]SUB53873.1 tetracycline repressor protein TetR [Nocardia brasiliensis]